MNSKTKKSFLYLILTIVLLFGSTENVSAEKLKTWVKTTDGWMLKQKNGEFVKDNWGDIYGRWYHFDSDGIMQLGWFQDKDGKVYLLTEAGMGMNWTYYEDNWYFMDEKGLIKTGWIYDDNAWFYLDKTGKMVNGWVYYKKNWYYLKKYGNMACDETIFLLGKEYLFDEDGAWIR
ncbi:hypothetical protein C3B58_18910 [Lactonifactor longoviformis]|uniref:Putative cell wall binding repeat-containing protein n=1 Tax=Lactonifactor longoviformis DSM 17459 TaxID=1122155 RepID=A0A1M5APM8_9CLOT|nr:hypothetical protein [Lactonifactor longoviformis]POP30904.1 hypothetical protein C3B58_18910 [Lactonifactor longoviformis]SHF32124.1 Putative cell wall binding repeat-containing protein [Lactonifactor longoviformis DSM 17459]